jgi:2-polyprenyl-3-methyl-5-hydroxy-6-metoxy-1,4-benzoquinol methylase
MSSASNARLIEQVRERYKVGENFASAYLDHWQSGSQHPLNDLNDIRNLKPPQSVWFEYALSTNQRAQKSWQEIGRYLPKGASRYLDIGCAYGGSLVAAAQIGLQVTGIEIDERLIRLGTANCQDHDLRDCIHRANILDEDLPQRLGTFDVITLMSVIEHVLDVPKTLQHCAELLAPGGILFLEVPNKFCTSFVARDPHFNLFGITLLDRPLAIQYHGHFFPDEYDVGDYYKLGYYLHLLHRYGCQTQFVITPSYSIFRLLVSPLLFGKLALGYLRFQRRIKGSLSRGLAHEIDIRSRLYLNGLIREFFSLGFNPSGLSSFQTKYLLNVWTLVAKKQSMVDLPS